MNAKTVQAIIFDFSRVILFPREISYHEGLNALHRNLSSDDPNYPFLHYFRLNEELLEQLRKIKDVPLYIFTSGYVQEAPAVDATLHEIFKHIYSADRMSVSKSVPETYAKLCKEIGVEPGKTLFVDDTTRNVEAAKQAGLQTHHYTNNRSLEVLLQGLGLIG